MLKVIIHAGNAKSHIYEALHYAKKNDFKKSDEYMENANEEILEAQKIQTR
ncbi:MAG: PTS lactose/cellobiose transporter subunit IIA, partial [Peptostreptococcaceae bacterium]|nr:PTS lactose/cellobiose transporter subunit IIA [Peptostreptococcaceae bacterium]